MSESILFNFELIYNKSIKLNKKTDGQSTNALKESDISTTIRQSRTEIAYKAIRTLQP